VYSFRVIGSKLMLYGGPPSVFGPAVLGCWGAGLAFDCSVGLAGAGAGTGVDLAGAGGWG
jgi:hypothetical protein